MALADLILWPLAAVALLLTGIAVSTFVREIYRDWRKH